MTTMPNLTDEIREKMRAAQQMDGPQAQFEEYGHAIGGQQHSPRMHELESLVDELRKHLSVINRNVHRLDDQLRGDTPDVSDRASTEPVGIIGKMQDAVLLTGSIESHLNDIVGTGPALKSIG